MKNWVVSSNKCEVPLPCLQECSSSLHISLFRPLFPYSHPLSPGCFWWRLCLSPQMRWWCWFFSRCIDCVFSVWGWGRMARVELGWGRPKLRQIHLRIFYLSGQVLIFVRLTARPKMLSGALRNRERNFLPKQWLREVEEGTLASFWCRSESGQIY